MVKLNCVMDVMLVFFVKQKTAYEMRISDWSSDVCSSVLIESAEPAVSAADMWLALSQPERDATAVFASGRDARAVINQRIQDGLVAEGSVKGEHIQLTVYERVNTTREELR